MEINIEELPIAKLSTTELSTTEQPNNKSTSYPLKSAMKPPQSSKFKPKQSITYDSILENMGLCVYNDTLHELSKKAEDNGQETARMYPHVNKKPRNIPQNGYIYSKFNRPYVKQMQANQQSSQPQPRVQTQNLQQNAQPRSPVYFTATAKEYRNKLIRQIVHNNLVKKQVPQQNNKTLVISNF